MKKLVLKKTTLKRLLKKNLGNVVAGVMPVKHTEPEFGCWVSLGKTGC